MVRLCHFILDLYGPIDQKVKFHGFLYRLVKRLSKYYLVASVLTFTMISEKEAGLPDFSWYNIPKRENIPK
jgi:hypothetical protein